MSDTANLYKSVNDSKPAENNFAWGADEIGNVIGRNPRQTHHLLAGARSNPPRRSVADGSPISPHCFVNSARGVEPCVIDRE